MSRPFPKTQCCPHFVDYYDPNEWYTLFCNWAGPNVGFANFGSISGYRYFWDDGLDDLLNGLMVNYQWSPSDLTSQTTTTWTYRKAYDHLSDFSRTLYIVSYGGGPAPIESDYSPHTIDFTNNRLRLAITDSCTGITGQPNVAGKYARRILIDWFATLGSGSLTVSQNAVVASPFDGRSTVFTTNTQPYSSPVNDDTVELTITGSSRSNLNTTLGNFPLPIGSTGVNSKTSKNSGMTC